MPDEEGSGLVDLDQLERAFWWAAGVCWTIVAVIVLGEFRGWWNDLGGVSGTIATVIGGLLTIIALLINATKSQARAVRMGVTDNGRRLGLIHDGVMDNGRKLGMIHEAVEVLHQDNERQTDVLIEIRDRL